ncbi:hypothetical protein BC938DRAFT_472468 [Jimgerdemannia flammicorona]|nr:hypothetical protein BC938DRAFT_472468 [Jimgerdemannia flammicorona]
MSLPYELLLRVFYLLTPRDVCKCRRVCTAWRDISCDPSIWRNFYARFARTFVDVPLMPVATAENEDGYQQDTIDWEERYTFLRTRETKWRKGRPQYTHVWKAHAFPIRCLVLSDHTLVTATDFTLRAWDLSVPLQHAGEVPGFVEREMERVLQYLNVARNRGTLFVTFAVVGLIHMYDLKTLDHKGILNISEPISFVTVANDLDEYIVVVTFGGLVKVFDPSDGTVLFMMHNGFTAVRTTYIYPSYVQFHLN